MEARALLTQDLQNRSKAQDSGRVTSFTKESNNLLKEDHYSSSDVPSENMQLKTFACDTDIETEKHPVVSTEMQIVDKSVVEEEPVHKNKDLAVGGSSRFSDQKYEDDGDGDDWPDDESTDMMGFTGTSVPLGNEEDVSFSDLEDDDDKTVPTSSKAVTDSSSLSSGKGSRDWVQLNKSSSNSKDDHSAGSGNHGSGHSQADHDNKDSNDWLNVDKVDVI